MDYLKQVFSRIAEFVRKMSVSQVVMLVAVIAGTIVGMVAVAGWLTQVTYQPLYTNLEPSEAAEVTRHLSEQNIGYRISGGGGTIEVPESDVYNARMTLASEGLPHSGVVGYSIFDETNLGMTDFLQKLNFRRALEGELSRTITALNEVQTARVHIVIPEDRLFRDQQEEATASVVLKLKRSGAVSKPQIAGITHLVAASVEGLEPGNITIVDYNGNLLSSENSGDELAILSASQIELTQAVENDLEQKAQTMLNGVLGPGKSIVRVTAELNFDQYSRTSETYDPNSTVVRSEQKTESSDVATKKLPENGEDKQDNSSEVTVTNYEVSKSIEEVTSAVGTIKRLSVAVLLDGNYKTINGDGGRSEIVYEPRPQDEMDRLSAIVKNAVGFQPDRNDQMELVNIAFDKTYLKKQQDMLDDQLQREFYLDIAKKIGLVLLVALAFFWVRKKLKKLFASLKQLLPSGKSGPARRGSNVNIQAGAEEEEVEEPEPEPEIIIEKRQPRLVDRMQKAAKDDPDEIAKVIRTLMVE